MNDEVVEMLQKLTEKIQNLEPIATSIQDEYFRQNAGVVRPGHPMNIFAVSFNAVYAGTQSESFFEMIVFDENALWDNVIEPWINE